MHPLTTTMVNPCDVGTPQWCGHHCFRDPRQHRWLRCLTLATAARLTESPSTASDLAGMLFARQAIMAPGSLIATRSIQLRSVKISRDRPSVELVESLSLTRRTSEKPKKIQGFCRSHRLRGSSPLCRPSLCRRGCVSTWQ